MMLILCIGLFGCGVKTIKVEPEQIKQPKQPTELQTIGNLDAIGMVLGCMFDPAPCEAKRKLQETEDSK